MWILEWLLTEIGAIVLRAISSFVATKAKSQIPVVAAWVISSASRWLPEDRRQAFIAESRNHLLETDGEIGKLSAACGMFIAGLKMAHIIRRHPISPGRVQGILNSIREATEAVKVTKPNVAHVLQQSLRAREWLDGLSALAREKLAENNPLFFVAVEACDNITVLYRDRAATIDGHLLTLNSIADLLVTGPVYPHTEKEIIATIRLITNDYKQIQEKFEQQLQVVSHCVFVSTPPDHAGG